MKFNLINSTIDTIVRAEHSENEDMLILQQVDSGKNACFMITLVEDHGHRREDMTLDVSFCPIVARTTFLELCTSRKFKIPHNQTGIPAEVLFPTAMREELELLIK